MRNRDTKMLSSWTERGQGSLLADLIDAAYTVERVQRVTPLLFDEQLAMLRRSRQLLEDDGRGAEWVNLKTERGNLLISNPRGCPTTEDALRVNLALYVAAAASPHK